MDYFEHNKILWKEHFTYKSLDYPDEQVVRFLARCRQFYPNGVVLDWGCATGRHVVLGCKFGYQVIAVDYVEHCVNITKEKVKKEYPQLLDTTRFIVNQGLDVEQVEDDSVDMMLLWGCMVHSTLEQQKLMYRNVYRMLKKGGRAFCTYRSQRDSIYEDKSNMVAEDMFLIPENEYNELAGLNYVIPSLDQIKETAESCGFQVETAERYEFTQKNQKIRNSWWHITFIKE